MFSVFCISYILYVIESGGFYLSEEDGVFLFRRDEFLGRINEIVYFLPFSR